MPSKRKRISSLSDPLQVLRGGKAVPKDLVHRCLVDLQEKRKAQRDQRNALERRMVKHLGQAHGSAKPDSKDPRVAQSLDGLLGIHKKLATQKLAAPKVLGGLGGILPGQITVNVVPPFDYDIVLSTVLAGNDAIREASSDKTTGKMSVSAVTSLKAGFGGGSMYTTVGIYFHPLGPGTLTVRTTPTYSFQWWTNSIRPTALVRSSGSGGLTLYGVDVASQTTGAVGTIVSTAGSEFELWDESHADEVHLDFGFDIQAPTSAQIDVNHNLVYLLFVDAEAHVEGVGWPGSLAGSKLSVTVPSITYDFQMQQVFHP